MISRKAVLGGLLVLWLVLGAGCGPATPGVSPLPTPVTDPAALLTAIALDPATYAGKQVTVEGVLESTGQMPNVRFFLSDVQNHRLETSAWAPLEVMQPPQGTAQPKIMAYFVGKRLRLTGTVTRSDDLYILEVSTAAEP